MSQGGGDGVITEGSIERGSQHTTAWHTLPVGVAIEQLATTLTGRMGPGSRRLRGASGMTGVECDE